MKRLFPIVDKPDLVQVLIFCTVSRVLRNSRATAG